VRLKVWADLSISDVKRALLSIQLIKCSDIQINQSRASQSFGETGWSSSVGPLSG